MEVRGGRRLGSCWGQFWGGGLASRGGRVDRARRRDTLPVSVLCGSLVSWRAGREGEERYAELLREAQESSFGASWRLGAAGDDVGGGLKVTPTITLRLSSTHAYLNEPLPSSAASFSNFSMVCGNSGGILGQRDGRARNL